jgi:hypothetical protein
MTSAGSPADLVSALRFAVTNPAVNGTLLQMDGDARLV